MTQRKLQKIGTPRLCEDCDRRVPRVLLSPHPPKAGRSQAPPRPRLENVAAKLVIWKGVRNSQVWLKQPNLDLPCEVRCLGWSQKQKFQYFVRRTRLENAITVRCKFGLYFGEINS